MPVPSLPQEIIYQILSHVSSKELCALLSTSKSIYVNVTGILHARLRAYFVNKGDHKFIFEAFLPTDQRRTPYHTLGYDYTSLESPTFTAPLYSYFSPTPRPEDQSTLPDRSAFSELSGAAYSFNLPFDDPWAILSLEGNILKLSPEKPGLLKATVTCFRKQDFVRLKKTKLDELAESGEGEMIWVNEGKEGGVWTRVIERLAIDIEEGIGRQMVTNHGVPFYRRPREEGIKYTLNFEYLAIKTGLLLAKLDEMDQADNNMAFLWRGPSQREL